MISRILQIVAVYIFTTAVHAVTYTIPGDSSLSNAVSDWFTLEFDGAPWGVVNNCQGWPGNVCDVPAGTYKLVNHSTGETQRGIRVGASAGSPVSFASNTCSGGRVESMHYPDDGPTPTTCSASCPAGSVAIGVSRCQAHKAYPGPNNYQRTIFGVNDFEVFCQVANVLAIQNQLMSPPDQFPIVISVGAVCLEL